MLRVVCGLGMQLQMKQCGCNGAAASTCCALVIVVCLGRYVVLTVSFLVPTLCLPFNCVIGLLLVAFRFSVLFWMNFDC